MIQVIVILCLIITGIHIAFQQGNVLSFLRVWIANRLDHAIGKKWSAYAQKPLWSCLPCMGSVWSIVILWHFDVLLICAVCGLNVIIARIIETDEIVQGDVIHGETEYFDDVPTISRQKLKH